MLGWSSGTEGRACGWRCVEEGPVLGVKVGDAMGGCRGRGSAPEPPVMTIVKERQSVPLSRMLPLSCTTRPQ